MLARQQADSSYGGFAKLAPLFFFSFHFFFGFIFICSLWAPRVGLDIDMGWGVKVGI